MYCKKCHRDRRIEDFRTDEMCKYCEIGIELEKSITKTDSCKCTIDQFENCKKCLQ